MYEGERQNVHAPQFTCTFFFSVSLERRTRRVVETRRYYCHIVVPLLLRTSFLIHRILYYIITPTEVFDCVRHSRVPRAIGNPISRNSHARSKSITRRRFKPEGRVVQKTRSRRFKEDFRNVRGTLFYSREIRPTYNPYNRLTRVKVNAIS